jgi:hypothetical protein
MSAVLRVERQDEANFDLAAGPAVVDRSWMPTTMVLDLSMLKPARVDPWMLCGNW